MKYEFIKVDEDTSKLKYKDKEFTFKTSVKIVKELQDLVRQSRIKAISDLSKQGQSIKDFTIETKENGKTYYDNSNRKALEMIYQEEAILDFYNNKCMEITGMDLTDLMIDIGIDIDSEEQGAEFSKAFMQYLSGNIPSREYNRKTS